jgi:hypothetical protein
MGCDERACPQECRGVDRSNLIDGSLSADGKNKRSRVRLQNEAAFAISSQVRKVIALKKRSNQITVPISQRTGGSLCP